MSDMFDDISRMAKTEEGRAELKELAEHLKGEFMPLIDLGVELFGADADNAVDTVLKWSARKAKVMYDAYLEEGFTRDEAMALTISARASFGDAMNNLR